MIDREVLESKLRFLREYMGDLKEYREISLKDYLSRKKDQRFLERTLHLACECCIDIAAHIISRQGFREPTRPHQPLLNNPKKDRWAF